MDHLRRQLDALSCSEHDYFTPSVRPSVLAWMREHGFAETPALCSTCLDWPLWMDAAQTVLVCPACDMREVTWTR